MAMAVNEDSQLQCSSVKKFIMTVRQKNQREFHGRKAAWPSWLHGSFQCAQVCTALRSAACTCQQLAVAPCQHGRSLRVRSARLRASTYTVHRSRTHTTPSHCTKTCPTKSAYNKQNYKSQKPSRDGRRYVAYSRVILNFDLSKIPFARF